MSAVIETVTITPHSVSGAWIASTIFWFQGYEYEHYYMLGHLHSIDRNDARLVYAQHQVREKALVEFLHNVQLITQH